MPSRRKFIQAAASGILGLSTVAGASSRNQMHILILGGTGFIGPHMVEAALARGHKLTLFNRGKTNTELFPEVEKLVGDRDGQLDALRDRQWDAVIDNSGYVPRLVSDSANLLREAAPQYLFVSSISAYKDFSLAGMDEDHALATMPDETVEEVTGETYGPMKALCEQAVWAAYPVGTTIIRPGYIVGPRDRSDRWTYWPVRVARGGRMLVPGNALDPVQIIDARDLASFAIRALESRVLGTYNVAGPAQRLSMGEMLATLGKAAGVKPEHVWLDADALAAHQVSFPIWSSPTGDTAGLHTVSNARAIAAGLTFTPLANTASDTLAWWQSQTEARRQAMRAGLRVSSGPTQTSGPATLSMDDQMNLERELLKMGGSE